MGAEDQVVQLQQLRGGGQGLLGEHVQPRAADAVCLQGVVQGVLVHQIAPGGVHQHGGGLHLGDAVGVHDVVGLLGIGDMDADGVGGGEQLIQVHQLHPQRLGGVLAGVGVIGHHAAAQAETQAGQDAANGPQP